MKSLRSLFLVALAISLLGAGMAAGDGKYGGGHYRGGGYYGGGHYGGHHRGGVDFFIGGPFWDPFWYYPAPYYSPYYYPNYYPYYAPEVPSSPSGYIERDEQAESSAPSGFWYYCPESKAYYPYVRECPGGWQTVPAEPPSGQRR
jgi:hypothetical protein